MSDLYEASAVTGLEKIIRDRDLRKWAHTSYAEKTIVFRGA